MKINLKKRANGNKEKLAEAKRLDALRIYLSQGERAKKNKNLNILRTKGEINYNENIYKNNHPMMIGTDLNKGIPEHIL